ncbi:MAG: hypothetical protein Q4G67_15205 [Actinomycetia bacterium]|nr:hypothetical protein [Actinomycetes bacterium]
MSDSGGGREERGRIPATAATARYRPLLRASAAVIFIAAGIANIVLGRLLPESYGVFGETALLPWLSELWESFVMPNVGLLTIVLGLFQIACGLGVLWAVTVVPAAWGMVLFLTFVTVLGYGFPAESIGEDLLRNRLITIVMAAVLVPLLIPRRRGPRSEKGSHTHVNS